MRARKRRSPFTRRFRAEFATGCSVEDCEFSSATGYAMEFGRGCKEIRIVGNELRDLGAGGIRLGEPAARSDEFDLNYGNIVTDNRIHKIRRVYADGIGVIVFQSGRNLIAHNEISDTYTAISVGAEQISGDALPRQHHRIQRTSMTSAKTC